MPIDINPDPITVLWDELEGLPLDGEAVEPEPFNEALERLLENDQLLSGLVTELRNDVDPIPASLADLDSRLDALEIPFGAYFKAQLNAGDVWDVASASLLYVAIPVRAYRAFVLEFANYSSPRALEVGVRIQPAGFVLPAYDYFCTLPAGNDQRFPQTLFGMFDDPVALGANTSYNFFIRVGADSNPLPSPVTIKGRYAAIP
jgi:hypothetical protein